MQTYTLYHGTKYDVDVVMNNPQMKPSANGYGFYLTRDLNIAKKYGRIIAFEVPHTFEVDRMLHTENGMEYIISTTHTMREFIRTMEDCWVADQQTIDEFNERIQLSNMGLLEGMQF